MGEAFLMTSGFFSACSEQPGINSQKGSQKSQKDLKAFVILNMIYSYHFSNNTREGLSQKNDLPSFSISKWNSKSTRIMFEFLDF